MGLLWGCGTTDWCTRLALDCSALESGRAEPVDEDGDVWSPPLDCNDRDPNVYPHATEICDGQDSDCDGLDDVAEGVAFRAYADQDLDGYGNPESSEVLCSGEALEDGQTLDNTDCNDANLYISPARNEACNDVDDDCNGVVDDGDGSRLLARDADGDGFGDPAHIVYGCARAPDEVPNDDDCDDSRADVAPDAPEVCDGVDNNCDTTVDESTAADALWLYLDRDGDGYGDATRSIRSCEPRLGYVEDRQDCNDTNALHFPGAAPRCNSEDADCDGWMDGDPDHDGQVDQDADGDGFSTAACAVVDCDDADPLRYPGAHEICEDGEINDCDRVGEIVPCVQSGVVSDSAAVFYGTSNNDSAGYALSSAGDVDGDGLDDILIGAYGSDTGGPSAGAVYLVLGGALSGSQSIASVAEATFTGSAGDVAGSSVASAGDVDGDGYGDLLIGAIYSDVGGRDAGAAHLILGGALSGTLSLSTTITFVGRTSYEYAGTSLASAGDVDGDGRDDLLVGGSGCSDGTSTVGCAYVILGGALSGTLSLSSADVRLVGENTDDEAGDAVSSAGDVDGDGAVDLLIGAHLSDAGGTSTSTDSGVAYLVLNGGLSAAEVSLSDAEAVFEGESSGDMAGSAVSLAGDSDGDGLADILIAAAENNVGGLNAGAVYWIRGGMLSGTRSLSTADAIFIGETAADNAGSSVASAGDVDEDGLDDILIGAYRYDSGSLSERGAAYLLLGGFSGTLSLSTADARLTGELGGDQAGISVAATQDVDGDGRVELLVGAHQHDERANSNGAVYLVFPGLEGL